MPSIRFPAVHRSRLFPENGGPPRPLTVVRAPAGYGKTTLVKQWVASPGMSGFQEVWLRCPDLNGEDENFWTHLLRTLEVTDLGGVAPPASLTPRGAVEWWVEHLRKPTVLIVDDYQQASSPAVDLAVMELLEINDMLHLVIVSRSALSLEGPVFASQALTTEIGPKELRFAGTEIKELAELHGIPPHALPPAVIEGTGGWPLAVGGVVAAFAQGKGLHEMEALTLRFGWQQLEMVRSAHAEKIFACIVHCELISEPALLGALEELYPGHEISTEQVKEGIAGLLERGLILEEWFARGPRYRAQPTLAAALEGSSLVRLDPRALKKVLASHAHDLAEDDAELAATQLFLLGEYAAAEGVVVQDYRLVYEPHSRLAAQLRKVPVEDLADYRVLTAARFIVEMADESTSAAVFDELHSRLRDMMVRDWGETPAADVVALVSRLMAERIRGSGRETLRIANQLERQVLALGPESRQTLSGSLSFIFAAIGLSGLLNGDVLLAQRSFKRALESAREQANQSEQIRGLSGLALTAAATGELQAAKDALVRAEQLISSSGISGPHISLLSRLTAKSLLYAESGDEAAFLDILREIEPHLARAEQTPLFVLAEIHNARTHQGPHEALAVLRRRLPQLEAVFHTTPYLRATIIATRVDLASYLGGYAGAAAILERLPVDHPMVKLSRARLALFRGELHEAEADALTLMSQGLSLRRRAEIALLLAIVAWEQDQKDAVFELLRSLAEIVRDHREMLVFGTVPYESLQPMTAWAAKRAQQTGSEDEKRDFEGLAAVVAALPETVRARRYEPLSVAELRTLRELASGKSRAEIAKALYVTHNTVKFHLRSVYRKLGASNREEALERARDQFLIES